MTKQRAQSVACQPAWPGGRTVRAGARSPILHSRYQYAKLLGSREVLAATALAAMKESDGFAYLDTSSSRHLYSRRDGPLKGTLPTEILPRHRHYTTKIAAEDARRKRAEIGKDRGWKESLRG